MTDAARLAVLQVNTSDVGGGAENVAYELHRAARARGSDSTLAVGFRRTNRAGVVELSDGGGIARRAHRSAVRHGRPREARLARSLGDPGVLSDLVRGREDFRFPSSHAVLELAGSTDVVHLHNLHGGYFDLRLLPALSTIAPTVITLHDEWTLTGHCAMTLGCDRWRDVCGACPHLDVYPRLRRDGTTFNLHRKQEIWGASRLHVVTPTRWLLERAQASILRSSAVSWHVVSNGVDLDAFCPGDRDAARGAVGIPPDALVVVFVAADARMSAFKDLPTLERALGVLGETDGADVVALVVGDAGPTRRLGRVEIRHTGFLERAAVVQAYRAADLYVHPTRAEIQPLSLIEALATGLPAVASAVGGVPDLIRDRETGLLVPPGDVAALAAAVSHLLDDPDLRSTMSRSAVQDARARFAHADHLDGYFRVYESAVASTAASARAISARTR